MVPQLGNNPNVRYPGVGAGPQDVNPTASKGAKYDTEMWRHIRQGAAGNVTIADKSAAQLVQSEGELWRNVRNGKVSTYGGWLLAGVTGLIAVYYLVRGRIRIKGGRTAV